ncbi:MAG: hypothetical protein A2268_09255 [Candidatus Raymondbacteria bacterium RifOxyA12_full_50_37]|uniref:FlgD Ig-like domain-containing protein n=1 Tax=Candidatus Raymondbacteria bacterium RIFOXYD12_FULL_49_13 TaxID=1817890 RepID=A0A1F7FGQ8_UNCRA|nr:MAG: hypothetical protein A2268_09255 [Candidatus Raymondbacteria bacterium RifOxyA12_full_50_37]OGJ91552.1 MAG: hypothetical protein A2248_09805 [Candidatus Raymondbacteria bacterium RIFOXYA2_FULL_49_16]OGJ95485.1 MAG: hypothetical protein A2350_11895 [Candidatus Raymondbacteria bacterium RifOxyB12_full_50_8]OGK00211.1 MAG: hypothetical protein A2487_09920 [Candidatus Raymondbacteria bacterium RifOxyC12_full_50_8]OGK05656.1 MAG: hypothetical protein A2519_06125 [Candidatus Raymondbacteria b
MVSDLAQPQWQLLTGPTGMVIDTENGKLGWYPTMEQAYRNTVSVTDGDETQTFQVYVLALDSATRANCRALNDAFNAAGSTEYYQFVNEQMVMHLGDSQSNAQAFGMNSAMTLYTTLTDPRAHSPLMYGYYQPYNDSAWICSRGVNCSYNGSNPVNQSTCNSGQDGGMRATGHGSFWGSQSGMQMSWGLANVERAWNNHCYGGPAFCTVHFGANDGAAGVPASTYTTNLRGIVDFLISKNTIPILITTPMAVPGGGWGSPAALALYEEYTDSMIAVGMEYHIPVIDLHSAVQTSLNTVPGLTINNMLADAVHYLHTMASIDGGKYLHNPRYAGVVNAHNLNHLIGYFLDTETKSRPPAWAKFSDLYRPADYSVPLVYSFSGTATQGTALNGNAILNLISIQPNPANPSATVGFQVPASEAGKNVSIKVYDCRGAFVKQLASATAKAGMNSIVWNGKNNQDLSVSSGIYVISYTIGSFSGNKRFALIR